MKEFMMMRINMVKVVILLSLIIAVGGLLTGCASKKVKASGMHGGNKRDVVTGRTAHSGVDRLYIPVQVNNKSAVINTVTQGLGSALREENVANLIIVDSPQNANCTFAMTVKKDAFTDSGWKEVATAKRKEENGFTWVEYKRTTRYVVNVNYTISNNRPGSQQLKGNAHGDVSSIAKLSIQRTKQEIASGKKPIFPKIPGKPENEKELAIRCGQELILKMAPKIAPYFSRKK
jgi:major membrane immunogen (membrane-anchored lipoprotein)